MLKKIIYKLGERKYNDQINYEYQALKETEDLSLEGLKTIQLNKVQDLILYAYNNSQFYKKRFEELNVKPDDLKTLDDLKKFPELSKSDLRNYADEISIYNKQEKMYYSETSGSTGEPLVFYRNQKWDAIHRASILRGYSWHGVYPYEKSGYLWGYNIDSKKSRKIKVLDFLQNRERIFTYKDEELNLFLNKMQSFKYLEGYSSMIYELAKKVNETKSEKYDFSNLKMVKGTSEKIFDSYKDEVQKAFGLNFISEYGAAEAGIIAFECTEGNMHITMENVIVEVVANEILVTNLSSHSFPIIRYRLGDYVELESDSYKCSCGMSHTIIKSVLGRVGNKIVGNQNSYPSLTLYYVFKNLALQNKLVYYQAIQEKEGELILNIEQRLDLQTQKLLKTELLKYFKDDVIIIINEEVELDRQGGKMRDFISKIN